MNMNIKKERS